MKKLINSETREIQKGLRFNLSPSSIAFAIIFLALTQLPTTINQTLKLVCFSTTRADYISTWSWKKIPLDERIRYCHGFTSNE